MQEANERIAMRTSWITIAGNAVLSVFKMIAGIVGNSSAMISDAVHSISDILSTFVVMIGIKVAGKAKDDSHPYGHERFECVAAILLAVILCATGIGIGYSGVMKLIDERMRLPTPSMLALVAAIVSIVVKEAMYWYTRFAAKKIDSGALMADAWHHRSDALSSIASLIGIFGARMGYPILDPLATIVICLFIVKAAYDIFMSAVHKMTDAAADPKTEAAIEKVILGVEGVVDIDLLYTRLFASKLYVDVEISVNPDLTLRQAHTIAELVHNGIEASDPRIKHVMVHVNPEGEEKLTSVAVSDGCADDNNHV